MCKLKYDKKKLFEILIPVLIAVIVVSGFAISGHITKNFDNEKPTAQTSAENQSENEASDAPLLTNSKVTLVAVGDNLIHNTLISAGQKENGAEDYSGLYENIKPYISSADIAVINQETILGGSEFEYTGYPVFNTPWALGTAAIDAGFDIFTCATNHAMDKGFKGIQNECAFLMSTPRLSMSAQMIQRRIIIQFCIMKKTE